MGWNFVDEEREEAAARILYLRFRTELGFFYVLLMNDLRCLLIHIILIYFDGPAKTILLNANHRIVRDQATGGGALKAILALISMTVLSDLLLFEAAQVPAAPDESELTSPPAPAVDIAHKRPHAAERACLKRATQRLSPALLHVVHQSTTKSRDRAMAALIVLIYGPTPFGGANNIKDVAKRYGMTERNLYQLIDTLRGLLQSALPAEGPDD
jgi:hypothetical protein